MTLVTWPIMTMDDNMITNDVHNRNNLPYNFNGAFQTDRQAYGQTGGRNLILTLMQFAL
jgi:hypothetical protein